MVQASCRERKRLIYDFAWLRGLFRGKFASTLGEFCLWQCALKFVTSWWNSSQAQNVASITFPFAALLGKCPSKEVCQHARQHEFPRTPNTIKSALDAVRTSIVADAKKEKK
jgi:hypothetical protein